VVESVEDNQYGIGMILGVNIAELETNGAGIHHLSGGCSRGSLRGGLAIVVVRK
jgi:hypothetical protein